MKKLILVVTILLTLVSCMKKTQDINNINSVSVDVRFDLFFEDAKGNDLLDPQTLNG